MKQGYVTFKAPMILITGVEDFDHNFSQEQKENLKENGSYLERVVYGTDTPDELSNVKLHFTGKYYDGEEIGEGFAYLVNLEGNEVLIEEVMDEGPYEESYTIPDHLFEIE